MTRGLENRVVSSVAVNGWHKFKDGTITSLLDKYASVKDNIRRKLEAGKRFIGIKPSVPLRSIQPNDNISIESFTRTPFQEKLVEKYQKNIVTQHTHRYANLRNHTKIINAIAFFASLWTEIKLIVIKIIYAIIYTSRIEKTKIPMKILSDSALNKNMSKVLLKNLPNDVVKNIIQQNSDDTDLLSSLSPEDRNDNKVCTFILEENPGHYAQMDPGFLQKRENRNLSEIATMHYSNEQFKKLDDRMKFQLLSNDISGRLFREMDYHDIADLLKKRPNLWKIAPQTFLCDHYEDLVAVINEHIGSAMAQSGSQALWDMVKKSGATPQSLFANNTRQRAFELLTKHPYCMTGIDAFALDSLQQVDITTDIIENCLSLMTGQEVAVTDVHVQLLQHIITKENVIELPKGYVKKLFCFLSAKRFDALPPLTVLLEGIQFPYSDYGVVAAASKASKVFMRTINSIIGTAPTATSQETVLAEKQKRSHAVLEYLKQQLADTAYQKIFDKYDTEQADAQ